MNELQILGDEFDVDQPAGDIFEIPPLAVAFLRCDRFAHFQNVAGDHLWVTRSA